MTEYALIDALPDAATYLRLRRAVGWGEYEIGAIEAGLPSTIYCVLAMVDGQVVGMARIVGDGGLVYYVQDVIVLPAHQGNGIGTAMMDRIMAYVRDHAHRNTIVGLMAAKGREGFYERYGFWARPNASHGPGMIIFWPGRQAPQEEI